MGSGRGLLVIIAVLIAPTVARSAEVEATTSRPAAPLLIRNERNRLVVLDVVAKSPFVEVSSIAVSLDGFDDVESLRFYLADKAGAYSDEKPFGDRMASASTIVFKGNARLAAGTNRFWLSCRMKDSANLLHRVKASVTSVKTTSGTTAPKDAGNSSSHRIGVALRRHWEDGVHTYRIPALATTPKGTLLCVYDMRRRAGRDLQEDIDIGLLRSTDGGRTWGAQRVIMDMGVYGGLPQEKNGCSDPGIIVDSATGEIFCFAVWTHDRPGTHQWRVGGSLPGWEIGKSSQFMMVRSSDDGVTWTKPTNMTKAWKDPNWILYAPAPQQGIVLRNGYLVMPTQGRDAEDRHFSNLLISRDHGASWSVTSPASFGNTECQAVELSDGSIMLNCRSQSPTKFRTEAQTRDLGKTWSEHSTNRKGLMEPNCNGSLLRFDYRERGEAKSVLLFANPHSQKGRTHHSIQVSFDEGRTWPPERRLLLDEGRGAGYPSLSRVGAEHVGIVYEGSGAHIVFEKISLDELLGR